jgi:hypothetical protein
MRSGVGLQDDLLPPGETPLLHVRIPELLGKRWLSL